MTDRRLESRFGLFEFLVVAAILAGMFWTIDWAHAKTKELLETLSHAGRAGDP